MFYHTGLSIQLNFNMLYILLNVLLKGCDDLILQGSDINHMTASAISSKEKDIQDDNLNSIDIFGNEYKFVLLLSLYISYF